MTTNEARRPATAKIVTIVAVLAGVAALAIFGAFNLIDADLRVNVTVHDVMQRPVEGAIIRLTRGERTIEAKCSPAGECFSRVTVPLSSKPWRLEIAAPGFKPCVEELKAPERYIGSVTLARTSESDDTIANLREE